LLQDSAGLERQRLRKTLADTGVAVVRGLLEPKDIDRVAAQVREHLRVKGSRYNLGKTQPNAAVAIPELAFLFAHQNIVRLFRWILGDDNVVFTGHCDVHMNMLSGWHKDSGETAGGYFRGDYFRAVECRVFKIGIYLQDSEARSALLIRQGSHHDPGLCGGGKVALDTRRGDVVVFDVRITHAGQLPDRVEKALKAINFLLTRGSRLHEDSRLAGALKSGYWKLIGRRDRMSVFFTFGAPNSYTYDFAFFNVVRQNIQARGCDVELPQDLQRRFRELGIAAYDPRSHELWSRAESL